MRLAEPAIREMHSAWIDAVNAGDLSRLLALMADDVVYRKQPDGRWLLARDAHTLAPV